MHKIKHHGPAQMVCQIGKPFKPEVPVNISNKTEIVLGLDLRVEQSTLKLVPADTGNGARTWQMLEIDVDGLRKNFEDGTFSYVSIYDNDHVRVQVIDLKNGVLQFTEVGRDFSILKVTQYGIRSRR